MSSGAKCWSSCVKKLQLDHVLCAENHRQSQVHHHWRLIVKIEHYRLKADSIKHRVVLRQETGQYKVDGDRT